MKFDQVEVNEHQFENGDYRKIAAGRMNVTDYSSNKRDFKTREINVHGIDLSTIKQHTRTIGKGAQKFKVKSISFTDAAGVIHEIALFSR